MFFTILNVTFVFIPENRINMLYKTEYMSNNKYYSGIIFLTYIQNTVILKEKGRF